MGLGVGRLSYGCFMGQFGPWHFVSWQHHQTKGPRLWGVPEVGTWVYFLSGPKGSLPS